MVQMLHLLWASDGSRGGEAEQSAMYTSFTLFMDAGYVSDLRFTLFIDAGHVLMCEQGR